MSSGFKLDASSLESGLNALMNRSQAAIRMYAETAALKLQNYARDKAPWTALTVANGYKLRLAHGVNYGIWLELAHEKRFAIIQPTILANTSEIMEGFQGLLERLG